MSEIGRRYRIVEVLGEGGFGRVYRARLQDDQGFVKDVAIKVGSVDAPEPVLKRFRDEARILGLVRDRAIVNVEPPTRLGNRWAVVMEYVDGASLHALLSARGRLPPRVALGVVQEVARALDSVYGFPGPDGRPLQLVHRDLKPGNLQITRSGEVKILDFGLARARFHGREADSTTNIGGTLGYIAPERLEGNEGPAGDIYSLGVVLRTAITGVGPRQWKQFAEEEPTLDDPREEAARELADAMIELDPEKRPTARQVEERCSELAASMKGPTLRNWALEHVQPTVRSTRDALVGEVLSETLANVPMGVDDSQNLVPAGPSSRSVLLAATFGSLGTGIVVFFAVIGLVAVAWFVGSSGSGRGPLAIPGTPGMPEIADVLSPEDPEPTPEIEPVELVDTAVEPEPRRPRAVPTLPVGFASDPTGAEVYVDDTMIGTTPITGEALPVGAHDLRMKWGFEEIEAAIEVGDRRPTHYTWEVGEPLQVRY